jgi:hypothetical protein
MRLAGCLLSIIHFPTRHSRENGNPFRFSIKVKLDSRFHGNDGAVSFLGFGFWVLGFGFWVLGFGFLLLTSNPLYKPMAPRSQRRSGHLADMPLAGTTQAIQGISARTV